VVLDPSDPWPIKRRPASGPPPAVQPAGHRVSYEPCRFRPELRKPRPAWRC